jgi:hypothetical protein
MKQAMHDALVKNASLKKRTLKNIAIRWYLGK